jgi:hypothetical protein
MGCRFYDMRRGGLSGPLWEGRLAPIQADWDRDPDSPALLPGLSGQAGMLAPRSA